MRKLSHFEISYDEDKDIYHPGETVKGRVTVNLNASMEMKVLKILFSGRAFVQWDNGSDTQQSSHCASQTFFNKEICILGHNKSTDRVELAKGEHVYTFNFQLPAVLPSSYEDSVGFVRYFIKSSIVKPWKFDHNTKKAFTVLDTLDLNTLPSALTSSGASVSKQLCCFRCRSGPIELDFYVDRTAYVPGEYININASINNLSSRNISKTSAELYRNVTYRAQGTEKVQLIPILKKYGPGVLPNQSSTWINEKMQIPSLPPTEMPHCQIIDIEYLVQFAVHVPACSENLHGQAPIIIGTVPLQTLPQYRNSTSQFRIFRTPPPSFSTLPQTDMDIKYNNLPPPPSYAAAMEGSADIRESDDNEFTMGEMSYTPHYTYYDWNETSYAAD